MQLGAKLASLDIFARQDLLSRRHAQKERGVVLVQASRLASTAAITQWMKMAISRWRADTTKLFVKQVSTAPAAKELHVRQVFSVQRVQRRRPYVFVARARTSLSSMNARSAASAHIRVKKAKKIARLARKGVSAHGPGYKSQCRASLVRTSRMLERTFAFRAIQGLTRTMKVQLDAKLASLAIFARRGLLSRRHAQKERGVVLVWAYRSVSSLATTPLMLMGCTSPWLA